MTINRRVDMMTDLFDMIEMASGSNAKKEIIDTFVPAELEDDFKFCLEVLAGKYKLGYSLVPDFDGVGTWNGQEDLSDKTIQEVYMNDLMTKSATYRDIDTACRLLRTQGLAPDNDGDDRYQFWVKLCNREYRLGIGKSLLPISEIAPMLGELYTKKPRYGKYYVTEKLDGVRCICYYDGSEWLFISRNGRPLKISFDMTGFDDDYVYDGELLIPGRGFNYVDGVVNSIDKPEKANVTYNIFDMYKPSYLMPYKSRRFLLNTINPRTDKIKVVPLLDIVELPQDEERLMQKFLEITGRGGEGVMLNEEMASYKHKRGSHILKLKDTWTLDMKVIGLKEGEGKYEGMIGSLECEAVDETYGTRYHSFVGGLSDAERQMTDWIGKIIEVKCNGKSQNAKTLGTRTYSIRHARFVRRRDDKTTTSTD